MRAALRHLRLPRVQASNASKPSPWCLGTTNAACFSSKSPKSDVQIANQRKAIAAEFFADTNFKEIEYGHGIAIRTVEFNRPEKLNALTIGMVEHLHQRLPAYEENDMCHAVIFSGKGDKAFCAGGDINFTAKMAQNPATRNVAMEFFRKEYRLDHYLATTELPVVSFLNGITMGGGVGVSLHGKFVVATDKTLFAMPETSIGFFPDVGASYLLPRLGRRLAEGEDYEPIVPRSRALMGQGLGTYLALTGERLTGKEMMGFGLATHYMPASEYNALCDQLTGLRFQDYMRQEERDEMIHEAIEEMETGEAHQEADDEYLATVEAIFGADNDEDTVEGMFKRLRNHPSDWANDTLKTLQKMSPVSLKVTHRQMREGANKTCTECFQMEYRIASRMMANVDFYEGVRAAVVDKDRNPKWAKKTLAEVSQGEVDQYFAPLEAEEELVLYEPEREDEEHQ